ncbi:glucosaminidase domain-containing protein [Mucilaginibacter sp. UR6-1]|uniref:glucosaminidase domain-containing protein n=1 Tax=Mucilaginibacter sp. UR6-1 TaxID=1435643 RepID=UPI001E3695E1|nr:glucosaminidase domain-containing protein [Mucilaginibacter sp. UR6-1]MCC8410931.1 glucosaminidase domain-containing protein [Mucilaginibacter sp. UR6-1]
MRKLLLLFIVAAIALSSCSSRKKGISNKQARKNNKSIQKANKDAIAGYSNYTAQQYIERFKAIAITEMNLYGIPASITLAQGMFESGNGNGELAKVANNHFGIKCTGDWAGKGYYKDDDNANDCFRVYNNPEDSFRNHSEFLKKKRYAKLFELEKNDYEGWAYGLKAAGYATNPRYPQLLISVIKRYNLDQFDRPETDLQKIKREDRVLADINNNINQTAPDTVVKDTPVDKTYIVKQGDTLYNISKRFSLTVDQLKSMNNIADDGIKIGQKLIVIP